jgi:hypothetical protein
VLLANVFFGVWGYWQIEMVSWFGRRLFNEINIWGLSKWIIHLSTMLSKIGNQLVDVEQS